MEQQKLCMSCMRPLSAEDTVCPYCNYTVGRPNPAGYLPAGLVLQEHYIVGRALGSYGDACIYMGYDKLLKSAVFIREFFPVDFCERASTNSVVPVAGKEEHFDSCRESFFMNARALAKLKDLPSLLPLYDIFTANETVYAIYDHCEGHSLSRELKARGGRIPWTEARTLFMQLLASVDAMHRAGVYHLAISPETILMDRDGKLRLRSFAIPEARRAGSPIKPRFSPGFAAPEQYTANQPCGAPADIYGIAATLFTVLTGNVPPEAPRRVRGSQDLFLPAEVAEELPEGVGLALLNALQPDQQKRMQTAEELRTALSVEPAVNALLEDAEAEMAEAEQPQAQKKKKNLYPLLIGLSVFAILIITLFIVMLVMFPNDTDNDDTNTTTPSVSTTLPTSSPTAPPVGNSFAAPNVMGKDYYAEKYTTFDGEIKLEVEKMVYDDQNPKGTILSQTPAAGQVVSGGTVVKVVVSAGSEAPALPDVSGWPQEYAAKYLEALGYRVKPLEVYSATYQKGQVVETEPSANTNCPLGTEITLRVSNTETVESDTATTTATTVTP